VKITVRINEFKRVLEEARTAVPKRPPLDVLRYVRIDVNDAGQATMTASNLGITIIQSFEVVDGDAGLFLLHAEKAHSLLKGLSGGTATMEVIDGVVITAGGFVARVPSIHVSEFPNLVEPMPDAAHTLSLKFLRKLLAYVEHAAPETASSKGTIPFVQVDGTAHRLRAVATDGFRIAVADQQISGGTEFTLLIPKTVVPLIVRRAGATLRLAESETCIFLRTDGVLVQYRKFAGKFPGYQRAIPLEGKTTLDVNSAELKSVVERLNVIADRKHPHVYLTYANGALSMCTSSVENGEAEVRIEAKATGIDNKVKLNPLFVLGFLANAGDQTTISLVSAGKRAVFASGGFRYYIMPMVDPKPTEEPTPVPRTGQVSNAKDA